MGLNSMTGYQLNENSSKGRRHFNTMRSLPHFVLFCLIHRLIATDLRDIDEKLGMIVQSLDRLTSVIESKCKNSSFTLLSFNQRKVTLRFLSFKSIRAESSKFGRKIGCLGPKRSSKRGSIFLTLCVLKLQFHFVFSGGIFQYINIKTNSMFQLHCNVRHCVYNVIRRSI